MAENVVGLYPDNPHYLAVDGQPVFPIGATHVHGWTPISRPEHDYPRDLDRLGDLIAGLQTPRVRGLVRVVPYFPDPEGLQPWKRDADGRYRLDEFEPAWDARLEDFLEAALARELLVSLELWDDWSITRGPGGAVDPGPESGWNAHPFNPNNNANYDSDVLPAATRLVDAPFYCTIPEKDDNRAVRELQELYADHLCGIASGFPNILYNISNESRAPLAWSRYWLAFLRGRLGEGRLIGDMPSTNRQDGRGECDPELSPRTLYTEHEYDYADISQAVSRHEFGENPREQALCAGERIMNYRGEMDRYGHQKPLVVSKDYTNTEPDGIPVLWSKFVGGASTARFHRPMPGPQAEEAAHFQFEAVRRLGSFIKRVTFWEMSPNHELIVDGPEEGGALCLARRGDEYVIQLVGGRGGPLEVLLEPGEYRLHWYDPRADRIAGKELAVECRSEFGCEIESPPHKGDLIGHLIAL